MALFMRYIWKIKKRNKHRNVMKKLKNFSLSIAIALCSALIAVWIYSHFFGQSAQIITMNEKQPIHYTSLPSAPQGNAPDLTYAAGNSVHAVVHVEVMSKQKVYAYGTNPFLEWFYGDRYLQPEQRIQEGSGSGVIISPDGYIVTNNHVIDHADQIKVILNDKREFKAKLVGTDPTTDIALLKIDAKDLPILKFGNSDALKLGEWVLAVGNPFNLTSTVTAGIVSAKGRNIGINRKTKMSIESFIQTDAAVNPGNSGGALVNMNGELVGINTAIASQTGSYTGYSFAVPSGIVQKVVADLKAYGQVQRAVLGVEISDVNAEVAKKYDLDKIEGVFIQNVQDGGAAHEAGLKDHDVVLSIDGLKVNSSSELQELIGRHHPGDVITILIKRDHKLKQIKATLRNLNGNTKIIKTSDDAFLGATFKNISDKEKFHLGVRQGIQIDKLKNGKLKDAGIKEGFIITEVNKQPVNEVYDLRSLINKADGGILIEGIYPNGERAYYVFSMESR